MKYGGNVKVNRASWRRVIKFYFYTAFTVFARHLLLNDLNIALASFGVY